MPIPKELEQEASKVAKALLQTTGEAMSKEPLKVIAGAPDRPLIIGEVEIQCYVLEDETRVLSQGSFLQAIGRSRTPKVDVDELPPFLSPRNLKPFISNDLLTATKRVIFQAPSRGPLGHGYRAELLPQVCEVYLKARDAGVLLASQVHIAERAEILVRALATVGVIALVDEATGYQQIRAERALATILEKYIAQELQPWTKTFPYDFYRQIFRLKGWIGPEGAKRPSVIGHYTNDLVYKRLPLGVFEELKRKNPVLSSGNRRHKHHQWFTPDPGHSKLKEHIAGVLALMKSSGSWDSFKRKMNQVFPEKNMEMVFDGEPE